MGKTMDGKKVGYTTWGNFRGGCGHVHETLGEGVGCIYRDQSWITATGDGVGSDRWLYSLVLYPGDEIMRRPLSSEDKAMLRPIRF